jgi:hypothetical protein
LQLSQLQNVISKRFPSNVFVRRFKRDSSQRIVVEVLGQVSRPIERNHFCDARKGPGLRQEVEGLAAVDDLVLDLHRLDAARRLRRFQHQGEAAVGALAN